MKFTAKDFKRDTKERKKLADVPDTATESRTIHLDLPARIVEKIDNKKGVELTIKGEITGYSVRDWGSSITVKLEEGELTQPSENVFESMAEEDA